MNKIRLNSIFSKIFNSSKNSTIADVLLVKLLLVLFDLGLFFKGNNPKIESWVQKNSMHDKVLLVIDFKELIDSKFCKSG